MEGVGQRLSEAGQQSSGIGARATAAWLDYFPGVGPFCSHGMLTARAGQHPPWRSSACGPR